MSCGRPYSQELILGAIEQIDKTIDHLQKTTETSLGSENYLRLLNNKAEEFIIKKLTRGNPTMAAKFSESTNSEPGEEN